LPTVGPDCLTGRAWVYDATVVRDCHQRRPTRGAVLQGNGEHALACLLGSPACLCRRGLRPTLDRPAGDRGCRLRQRLHGHAVSSCHATPSPPPLALSVQHQDGHAGEGSDGGVDGRRRARRVLPSCHFGEPAGDMGMLRLDRAGLLKGGDGFGKPPLRQARVPVCKGPER
jgi:hypothetical protein